MTENVKTFVEDRIAHVIINRPDKKNSLTQEMYQGLADAINAADENTDVRCLLLYGAEGVFTAGNDLGDFLKVADKHFSELAIYNFMKAVLNAQKPVVVAIEGLAIGIGVTMLLHMDLVYADPDARFSVPFVNIALCPEFGSSKLFPQMLGRSKASEIILLGEMFGADDAANLGFVNKVSEPGKVMDLALEKAKALASKAPGSVRASKAMLKSSFEELEATLLAEFDVVAARTASPELKEAVDAFMEKRSPDFSTFE